MIEIIDDIVDATKQVSAFGGRVYRAYPQLTDRMDPFAVVEKGTHVPDLMDDEGNEIIVILTYTIAVFDFTPEVVDDDVAELTSIYNNLHIQNTGSIRGYQLSNGMYSSQVTISCKVDRRGFVYPR